MTELTHCRRDDGRINIVKNLIEPFQLQLDATMEITEEHGVELWDMVYADDAEHIVGIVFIILQNYINSSISDLYPDLEPLHFKYSIGEKIDKTEYTKINLIIAIANYYKHRDAPPKLHKHTANILDSLDIDYKVFYSDKCADYFHEVGSQSPVYTGLSKLSDSWRFSDLVDIVSQWREEMWRLEESKGPYITPNL